jgi:hypothetical protein
MLKAQISRDEYAQMRRNVARWPKACEVRHPHCMAPTEISQPGPNPNRSRSYFSPLAAESAWGLRVILPCLPRLFWHAADLRLRCSPVV